MDNKPAPIQLDYNGSKILVTPLTIQGSSIYRVQFENKTTPLNLVRAAAPGKKYFWTSMPEGRQQEAEAIGELLSNYFKKN